MGSIVVHSWHGPYPADTTWSGAITWQIKGEFFFFSEGLAGANVPLMCPCMVLIRETAGGSVPVHITNTSHAAIVLFEHFI